MYYMTKLADVFKTCVHIVPLLMVMALPVQADTEMQVLTQAQWNVPRSAATIVAMPPLQKIVHQYQSTENSTIQIRYAGGDEGTLWVHDVRGWLISLGIPSKDIQLLPGSSNPGQLELMVIRPTRFSTPVNTVSNNQKSTRNNHE